MGYIALGEAFQTMGSCGCGGRCGSARSGLSEWYEQDDDDDDNTPPVQRMPGQMPQRPGPPLGEAPPRLELQPPSLLQPDSVPPWQRRVQERMSRSMPQLQLRPEFMPRPAGSPALPPPPPPIDLRLSPEYRRRLMEQWERERERDRIRRILTTPVPSPPQSPSLGDAIRRYVDTNLENLLRNLRVPPAVRGPLRDAARDALGRGALEAMEGALNSAGIRGEAREAISSSVRAAIEQIRVP